eukprot:CAMPEP_0116133272 /NCGR_PEP_ID=MMETSP0329-20121206/10016_1 /TAXON_ID=697910 /ORGANISM="Pseudo-nitzschia arenysensis, Strain B593" /LENGTH=472 /DNA_ID=CAMNT_0003627889 /DNA_START=50 /DNA_END=1468 /DNA_ORIENTATION=+
MNSLLLLLLLGVVAGVDSASTTYVPARISFDELAGENESGGNDVFWKSLRDVGLLSVTDVPGFNKKAMIRDLEDCLHRQENVGAPEFNLDHLGGEDQSDNQDHFRRRTLATRTLSGNPEEILIATKSRSGVEEADIFNPNLCNNLEASSQIFRSAVQRVSEAVAERFGSMESLALDSDNNYKIPIETLINKGEHLEHFHSYYSVDEEASSPDTEATIDWHTDQGMMLLFTPGQFQDGTTTNGFYIQLDDGSTAEVAFDSDIDDLVIMLGDGVNQYINGNDPDTVHLRAVPHAVTLPKKSNVDTPRLWYGRMVLPPPEAIHPSSNGFSFGEIRTAMIEGDRNALALGCASTNVFARELMEEEEKHFSADADDVGCNIETSILCWMTCMSFAKKNVSVDSCTSQSPEHKLVCANDDGEVWEKGSHDPTYSLRCLEIKTTDEDMSIEVNDSSAAAAGIAFFGAIPCLLGLVVAMF